MPNYVGFRPVVAVPPPRGRSAFAPSRSRWPAIGSQGLRPHGDGVPLLSAGLHFLQRESVEPQAGSVSAALQDDRVLLSIRGTYIQACAKACGILFRRNQQQLGALQLIGTPC